MIDEKEITIQFFVDDCIISSKHESDVKDLVTIMNNEFRKKTKESNVNRGKLHGYLGIIIDFSRDDYLSFTMYDYI